MRTSLTTLGESAALAFAWCLFTSRIIHRDLALRSPFESSMREEPLRGGRAHEPLTERLRRAVVDEAVLAIQPLRCVAVLDVEPHRAARFIGAREEPLRGGRAHEPLTERLRWAVVDEAVLAIHALRRVAVLDVEPHRAAFCISAREELLQHRRGDTTPSCGRSDDEFDELKQRHRAGDHELTHRHVSIKCDPRLEALMRLRARRGLTFEKREQHRLWPAGVRELHALALEEQRVKKRAVSPGRAPEPQLRVG